MTQQLHSITRDNLHGVWCALIVPWTTNNNVDERRFREDIGLYADTGVHGLYTGGTTGEFYAQTDATYRLITELACRHSHEANLPIQIGATALSTISTCERISVARTCGADAVQLALPFWLELKDDEVRRFMLEVAEHAGDLPIVLYITERSKRTVSPALLGQLAREVPTLVGIKDTGSKIETLRAMSLEAPDLAIFGGEDFYTRLPAGGKGGYCSITGFNARKVVELYELCAAGRFVEAAPLADALYRLLHETLLPLNSTEGLGDSAIDRIMRVAGGGQVGLRCQSPYRSGTAEHVANLLTWCRIHTPQLLPLHVASADC